MKSIQLTDQVYEAIRFAALNAGMKDEVDFLRQSAYWFVLGRLAKYEAEIHGFESKYACTFEEFESRLHRQNEADLWSTEGRGL
jgi:UDP-glucose 6-dehydrogenase